MTSSVSLVIYLLDLFGVAVFAVSGALVAGRKRMDVFGIVVVAIVTAIGGGTIRDLVLGLSPVFWVRDPAYVITATVAALATFVGVRLVRFPSRLLPLFDAFGLAFATIIGCQRARTFGAPEVTIVLMGVLTGVAGGIVRDLLCGEMPLILHREIYATASLLGGVAFVALRYGGLEQGASAILAAGVVLAVRLAAIKWNLTLPVFAIREGSEG